MLNQTEKCPKCSEISQDQWSAVAKPVHLIGDPVALICDCQPDEWARGTVVGLSLQDLKWIYSVQLYHPVGFTEDCGESDLISIRAVPLLQSHWEAENQHIPY